MNKVLYIIFLSLFSLTIISCSEDKEESTTDTTAPVIAEITVVTTPTNDTTPDYTFSSSEAGTITYGGSCSSGTKSATSGNNTITFTSLNDGTTYSNCTLIVTDSAGNASNTLAITSFTIDTSPGVFVAVGNEGTIVKSTDNGSSFDNVTSPGGWDLGGVVFGNTTLVAVGQAGVVFSSTDNGSTWNKWMDIVNSSHRGALKLQAIHLEKLEKLIG